MNKTGVRDLESEFLEEPLVLAGLVSLLEGLLDVRLGRSLLGGVLKGVLVDDLLADWDVNRVSGWHDVVEVDDLDEWLQLVSAGNLLLAHALGHFRGYRSMPATRAWPYMRSWVPSLVSFTTT